nr:PH, RCC1 and FYVE domains-containing protein 1-like isoform X1 [Ipomoea batatas]GME19403.1 PH, RCC1 and FYVE domains-containing protein 1-like isoform X1 [Ipomoea batatas]
MAGLQRPSIADRDIDQAITALKKGAFLLKYGRRGKPKFCPFRLSSDESALLWYYGKEEKQLELNRVSRIIPGQRTAIFQRYPRPEKEYQSFSLIYNDRSLDLICKDKDEAEVWLTGLKALTSHGSYHKDQEDTQRSKSLTQGGLGKAFADIVSYTASSKTHTFVDTTSHPVSPNHTLPSDVESPNARNSVADASRVSLSSALSSSSHGSCREDFVSLGDVFIWGEGTGAGVLGGGLSRASSLSNLRIDAHCPRALESTVVLDVHSIACGYRHAVLLTKRGEVFSWGEEAGGRLGHGIEADIRQPTLIESLSGMNVEMVACGEHHTCAVTISGDLYTFGDGVYNCGLLGHKSAVSHWIPKKVSGPIECFQVRFVSCGLWHTALITTTGLLFTFGDGSFGALGHGNRCGTSIPREVEALSGLQTLRVSCGIWHTAAVVKIMSTPTDSGPSDCSESGKLFTWGDGEKGRLGHGDKEARLVPESIAALADKTFTQVGCGHSTTTALSTFGRVYTMGSGENGQLGSPLADGTSPICVEGKIANSIVREISCGLHHTAVLTSKSEVYTWGKGNYGQLGHGDTCDQSTPTLVEFFKDKQVKSVVCGSNLTAAICLHKGVSSVDNSMCSVCHNPFNFIRKRHNCYNCGLVVCSTCSIRKSLKASLAPSMNKPYRVCDDCFNKLQKPVTPGSVTDIAKFESVTSQTKFSKFLDNTGLQRQHLRSDRLTSINSFNLTEGRSPNLNVKDEKHEGNIFTFLSENVQRGYNSLLQSPASPHVSSKSSLSVPIIGSLQATYPTLRKASLLRTGMPSLSFFAQTNEEVHDPSKQNEATLSQEIKCLRAQVEELASKSQFLEAELERKTMQVKEATAKAAEESEKSQAAKEVITSLYAQLKKMSETGPDGHISPSMLDSIAQQPSNDPGQPSRESTVTNSTTSPTSDSSDSTNAPPSSNRVKVQQNSVRVIQAEPGVYITIFPLPGGGNQLKRLRFRYFSASLLS